jgi:hypothetical protein
MTDQRFLDALLARIPGADTRDMSRNSEFSENLIPMIRDESCYLEPGSHSAKRNTIPSGTE